MNVEKNKKRYNFLLSRKGSAKYKGSQDNATGSFNTSQDLRPLIDDGMSVENTDGAC